MAPLPSHRSNRRQSATRTVLAVAATLSLCLGNAMAQQPAPVRKLPPSPSVQARIPAGVDTGTPGTSDTLPLGTPVPPSVSADRGDLRLRSAGARAAARKAKSPLESASAASAVAAGCNPGPAGNPNGEAVALPGSGFTGQSASPKTAASLDRKRPVGRVAC